MNIEKNDFQGSPVDYVENEEDDGEDDEEGDVKEGIVIFLSLPSSKLPKLHLHQDGSVPAHSVTQGFITHTHLHEIYHSESCSGFYCV